MNYLLIILALLLTACSPGIDISRVKAESKSALYRHKIVSVTNGNVTEWTLEERKKK